MAKRKAVFAMICLFFMGLPLFAYDGTVWDPMVDNEGRPTSHHSWNQTRTDFRRMNFVQEAALLMQGTFGNQTRFERIFLIQQMDNEDRRVVDDHQNWLDQRYYRYNGDIFTSIIRRGNVSGADWDGWVAFQHWNGVNWEAYLVYFIVY